ncbi:thioredoxin family protein [Dokdonia sp. Dokd-P16]|uniref:thioredoxin family protein n=1 Tax=Dokdonia sp. Dokd-P16 TaxID=2173169 RepID=UPI000D5479CE|nr:thioredoxin family protein [Dokdonia sp. Dokd-P16]AWH75010.1 thioredoxin family protein [Dokdonia sp. Dokd-P16]
MKHIVFLLFFISTVSLQAQEAKWHTDFDKAKKVAQRQGKPIIMYFTGSDWCGPCKMLKKDLWETDEFIQQADDFVLLEVDIPFREDIISPEQKKKNMKLQDKYNKDKSFPTVLLLDSNGRRKDEVSGYSMLRDTAPYYAFFNKARRSR